MSTDFCLTPQVAVKYYEGLYTKVVILGATGGAGLEIVLASEWTQTFEAGPLGQSR
jgi:hypothetical protein